MGKVRNFLYYLQRRILSNSAHIIYLSEYTACKIKKHLFKEVPFNIIPHEVDHYTNSLTTSENKDQRTTQ